MRTSSPLISEPPAGASPEEMRAYVREGIIRSRPLLYEVHFYFVAWGNCENMLQILVGQPELLEAKKVFDGYRKTFEHYVAGRNSFEHFHDRLPGQKDAKRVKEIQPDPKKGSPHRIYSGFLGWQYVHSDMSWDISPNSLVTLDQMIETVLVEVHKIIDVKFTNDIGRFI